MDNPYWFTQGKAHHIDLSTVRRMCFEVTNIVSAGPTLAQEFETLEQEAGQHLALSEVPSFKLYMEFAESQLCGLLLQMALMVRTYDDVMKHSSTCEKYKAHAAQTSGRNHVGALSDGTLDIRQACNKIIHAMEIRAIHERVDRQFAYDKHGEALEQDIWYLTGEVELSGQDKGTSWAAVVHTQQFVEVVLDRIAFGYPAMSDTIR